MRAFKARNGADHVVSLAHAQEIDAAYGQVWPDADAAEADRLGILELSNRRALTKDERRRMEAATHIKNLHSCADYVEKHGIDVKAVLGSGAALDHVHGGTITYPCGCAVAVAFNHHRRTEPGNPTYPVGVVARCDMHPGETGHKELFQALNGKG